ncbi:MAG: hypothetical protein E6G79_04445 [Alphaproteobacteria bacterium]|nr:MAG: hypothetical protein E6G79_04445 [Alphaproteobacteria bacterium]
MLLAEQYHVLPAGTGEQQEGEGKRRLGADRVPGEKFLHVNDCPSVKAALLRLGRFDVAGRVAGQVVVFDAIRAKR